ncbi:hypothetical protein A2U01_0106130, partial [Trifolium medium]|nr:hypothetical protein [Trifolium medium]
QGLPLPDHMLEDLRFSMGQTTNERIERIASVTAKGT